jgi:hypothetical protein
MINVVGLGKGGCAVAELFQEYPEYKTIYIDKKLKGKNCFKLPELETIEEYEEKLPEFKKLSLLRGKTIFILAGGGKVSGASLKLLEKLKHTEITVLYIRPDPALTPSDSILRDKVVFGILQEYARSGLLKQFVFVENSKIESLLGDLSVLEYYKSINKVIVATLHMINFLLTAENVFGKMTTTREIDRISTIGIYDLEEQAENYLGNLTSPRQKIFLYAIKEEDLTENKDLIRLIQQQVRSVYSGSELDISYKITTTNYPSNFVYVVSTTNIIQQ